MRKDTSDLPRILSAFITKHMEHELGWSPRTVSSYSAGLLLLIRYAADHYQ